MYKAKVISMHVEKPFVHNLMAKWFGIPWYLSVNQHLKVLNGDPSASNGNYCF